MATSGNFVITKQGLRAARDAAWGGYKIPINGFVITSKVVSPSELGNANYNSLYDDPSEIVCQRIGRKTQNGNWQGTVDEMLTVTPNSSEGISVTIHAGPGLNDNDLILNYPSQWIPGQTVNNGNFTIRTIGLLSVNDNGGKILFGTAYLMEPIYKKSKNATSGEPGNDFTFNIPVNMSNVLNVIELTAEIAECANLPVAETEAAVYSIPESTSLYTSYRILNYANTYKTALALKNISTGKETWDIIPYVKAQTITLREGQSFAPDATVGKFVYFDRAGSDAGVFRLCQPTTNWQGVTGVRIDDNTIQISGVIDVPDEINIGESYYLAPNGGITPTYPQTGRAYVVGIGAGPYALGVQPINYQTTTNFTTGDYIQNGTTGTVYYVKTSFIKTNWEFDLQYLTAKTNRLVLRIPNNNATYNEYGFTRYTTYDDMDKNRPGIAATPYEITRFYPKKGPRDDENNRVDPAYDETITNRWKFTQTLRATAFQALWADVCEYYESDVAHEPGTLMQFGGEAEITLATTEVNGIISDENKAAFILNRADTTPEDKILVPLALTGRVMVRLEPGCEVKKADKLYLSKSEPGTASTVKNGECIARALEGGTEKVWCVTSLRI